MPPHDSPSAAIVYLDESGDLGWKFDAPYRQGGSSRFLTIGAVIVPREDRAQPKRVIKRLYRKFRWDTSVERKWSRMSSLEREWFAKRARALAERHPQILYRAIVVQKENVEEHIRADENKLYNYMIKLLLVGEMAKHDEVTLVPDERSVKVQSGNSLHDYLQTTLWFENSVKTRLRTIPSSSAAAANLQFTDMLTGAVQSHFEDANSTAFRAFGSRIWVSKLFHR